MSQLKVPTLFIVGEEDELTPPQVIEAAASVIPRAKVGHVPEVVHSVYFEKPDIFNLEVLRFIQGVAAPVPKSATVGAARGS